MTSHVWATDDSIEYVSITRDTLEGGLNVIRKSFFLYEKVCIGVELSRDVGAAKELEELCLRAAKDGVSVAAIDKETGQVVGISFNKLQTKLDNDQASYFTNYAANCKYPSARALVQFMSDADSFVNLFEITKSDCLLELMFLAVLPEYEKRGIATKLCEVSIQLGNVLKSGKNVKVSLDDQALALEPFPTVVSAIFTSIVSQHIGKKLGFSKAIEISYEKFMFEGKSFGSRIGPGTPSTTVEYLQL